MPAGNRVLPLRSNIPAISEFVFEAIDHGFAASALAKGRGIVVGGKTTARVRRASTLRWRPVILACG